MLGATLIGFGRFGKLFYRFFKDDFYFNIIDKNLSPDEILRQAGKVYDIPLNRTMVVFLAVPISEIENTARKLKKQISKKCTIVEFCSVQTYPLHVLKRELPENPIFAIHPLFGPDSVEDSLENHLAIVIENETWNPAIAYIWKLFIDKGVKLILMNENEHDELIAWTLCLTQYIGRAIGKLNIPYSQIAPKGFNELMNIVRRSNADTEQLFIDMNLYNPYAEEMRNKIIESFKEVDEYLKKIKQNLSSQ